MDPNSSLINESKNKTLSKSPVPILPKVKEINSAPKPKKEKLQTFRSKHSGDFSMEQFRNISPSFKDKRQNALKSALGMRNDLRYAKLSQNESNVFISNRKLSELEKSFSKVESIAHKISNMQSEGKVSQFSRNQRYKTCNDQRPSTQNGNSCNGPSKKYSEILLKQYLSNHNNQQTQQHQIDDRAFKLNDPKNKINGKIPDGLRHRQSLVIEDHDENGKQDGRVQIQLKDYKRCLTTFNNKTVIQDQGFLETTAYDQSSIISDYSLKKRLSSIEKRSSSKSPQSLLKQLTSLSKEELRKGDILNSVEYKLKNGIHSQYMQTDYFPEWIVKEMTKFDKKSLSHNTNIYKACEKQNKDRTENDRNAITYYLLSKVNFFKEIEREKLECLSQKIATLEYEPDQLMIKQGDDGDFLLIIYEGKASILVNDQKIAEAGPNTLIGETALEYRQKRKASVVAKTKCKCLAIYKSDYDTAVSIFKAEQKQLNQKLLRRISVFSEWNLIKLRGFSRILNEVTFKQGEIIYDVGSPSEVLYIIKSGKVKLEALYEIERTNMIPITHKQSEISKTFQIIKKTLLVLGPESQFGMEEVILEQSKRVIRTRALEDTVCLYCNKQLFDDYFNQEDKEKYKRLIKEYTDFDNEGKTLLNEVENRKFVSNVFLNAVNVNVHPTLTNSRSIADGGTSQLSSGMNHRKVEMIKKFLKRIKTQKESKSPYRSNTIGQKSLESLSSKDGNPSSFADKYRDEQSKFESSLNYSLDEEDAFNAGMKSKGWKTIKVKKKSIVIAKNNLFNSMVNQQKKGNDKDKSKSDNNIFSFLEKGVKVRLLTEPL